MSELHVPTHPVRLVTASSLFDGHDASINIMRRILQTQGCEVVHLGHNRSVQEVVDAALEEDVQGVAVSSYQGGHIEYFEYLVESLRERGAGHVHVVGGGGGVIVHDEIERLRESGVTIFSPEDGQRMGLVGMINSVVADCDFDLWDARQVSAEDVFSGDRAAVARAITGVEEGQVSAGDARAAPRGRRQAPRAGAGHHRHRRLRQVLPHRRARTPPPRGPAGQAARRRGRRRPHPAPGRWRAARRPDPDELPRRGPGLLPFAGHPRVRTSCPSYLGDIITVLKAAGFDLVVVETPGIGQGDAAIVPFVDTCAVRDDARVRRRQPAGEDRHARLRRRRRDQQVRAPRRGGRHA